MKVYKTKYKTLYRIYIQKISKKNMYKYYLKIEFLI